MTDVNVYQENLFHTKMLLKDFELENYLFGDATGRSRRSSASRSRNGSNTKCWRSSTRATCRADRTRERKARFERAFSCMRFRCGRCSWSSPSPAGSCPASPVPGSAGRRQPGRCSNAVPRRYASARGWHGISDPPGNLRQVFVQMLAHLVFGGGDEAQADPVAD